MLCLLFSRYNENGYIEDVEVNFIVWEIHGREDYTFNMTMKKVRPPRTK